MSSETKTILVVDDNPMTARWVVCLAEHLGFESVLASDGLDALDRLAEQTFAAVISDIEMPGMDGLEMLENVRARYPDLQVILMTATCDENRLEAAHNLGARALIEKPVTSDHLAALIGAGVDRPVKGMHLFSGSVIEPPRGWEPANDAEKLQAIFQQQLVAA